MLGLLLLTALLLGSGLLFSVELLLQMAGGPGFILAFSSLLSIPDFFSTRALERKDPTTTLRMRAHASEFPEDGHLMFCVNTLAQNGLPLLRLERWEPVNWYVDEQAPQSELVSAPEGRYHRTVLQTVTGSHPDDVRTLAEARPELEAEARRLEAEACAALARYRDEVRATLEQARLDYQAAEQSVRALTAG